MATTFKPDSSLVTSTALSPNRTVTNGRYARLICLHTMETPETSLMAENIGGGWFLNPAAMSSSHYNVDNDSIVQGVPEKDMAWTAPGTNEDGIQIEQAGRAAQTTAEWNDAYSAALLENTARLVADICRRNNIPPVKITDAQLAAGAKGIIDHAQASRVYRMSDHWDVGTGFPWDAFMAKVWHYYGGGAPSAPAPSNPTTTSTDWFEMATKADLENAIFNTPRSEWGGRTLTQMLQDNNRDTYSTLRMTRHLFNLYRLGIPGVITDGTFGHKIRQIFGYDEGKQAQARKNEFESDKRGLFRW
ncbi:N-acetylmuramoyl-L-alanine amidase [Rothia nasimurium]|uniref:N-acetylmuramoyl-L-alanine amidase n=1 Tax=Rothia nasimurium TaxID=85336 RepID=UPI001F2D9797|nr:N-acetylmuramoyl-L-alanine amidase [Rothia nasimurium]